MTATATAPAQAAGAASTATAPAADSGPPKAKLFDVGETLGIERFKGMKVWGYDKPWTHPKMRTPSKMAEFVWQEDQVFALLMFWYASASTRALKLIGHTGTGKSELALQWHAAFNLPLVFMGINPKTEAGQLVGGLVPMPDAVKDVDGKQVAVATGMQFVDGPLITAARYGVSIVLDEFNTIDPGEATGMNAFLEGKPYTIPETGETVQPLVGDKFAFRVFATMNRKTVGYRGRQKQDMANDDRFVDMACDYLPPELETPLVSNVIARVAKAARMTPDPVVLLEKASMFVKFANAARKQFMGESDAPSALSCTMSTRVLLRWVEYTQLATVLKASKKFDEHKSAAHWALRQVLSSRQEPEEAKALHLLLEAETDEKDV